MWWISYVVWRWCTKTTKEATIHYRKFKIDWQKRQYLSKTNEWKCSEKIHQWMKSYRRRRRLQLWHPIHPHPTHTSFPFNILHIRMNLNYQFNSININSSFTSFQMAAKIDISGKRNTRMLCVCVLPAENEKGFQERWFIQESLFVLCCADGLPLLLCC